MTTVSQTSSEKSCKYTWNMCNLFTRASQLASRCLRNTLTDLRLPKKSSKTGQKCFSFRGAKAWNHRNTRTRMRALLLLDAADEADMRK